MATLYLPKVNISQLHAMQLGLGGRWHPGSGLAHRLERLHTHRLRQLLPQTPHRLRKRESEHTRSGGAKAVDEWDGTNAQSCLVWVL